MNSIILADSRSNHSHTLTHTHTAPPRKRYLLNKLISLSAFSHSLIYTQTETDRQTHRHQHNRNGYKQATNFIKQNYILVYINFQFVRLWQIVNKQSKTKQKQTKQNKSNKKSENENEKSLEKRAENVIMYANGK